MILYLILIFQILLTKLLASRLCTYKYDSDNYPNYCSDVIELCDNYREFTIKNVTKLCDLFGYQNLVNINSCELYRDKQQKRSLYCVYKCNQTHYPNFCVPSGQVCPLFNHRKQCSLFHIPEWFHNISECNNHKNNTLVTTFEEESSYNKSITELDSVTFGIRTAETWNARTKDAVTLSLIWGHTIHQCTVFPFDTSTDYLCHSNKYDTHSCDSPLNKSWYGLQIDLVGDDGIRFDKVMVEIENKNVSLEVDYFCVNWTVGDVKNELNTYVSDKCSNAAGFDEIGIDSTPGDKYLIFLQNAMINLNLTPIDIDAKEAYISKMDKSVNCFEEDQYILVEELKTWHEAEEYCEKIHNSSLATIVSEEDFMVVAVLLSQKHEYTISYFWIGLNDLNKRFWAWVDGTACDYAEGGMCENDIHWLSNQPDNQYHNPATNGEDCAAIYALQGYNDHGCALKFNFLCNNNNYTSTANNNDKISVLSTPIIVVVIFGGLCIIIIGVVIVAMIIKQQLQIDELKQTTKVQSDRIGALKESLDDVSSLMLTDNSYFDHLDDLEQAISLITEGVTDTTEL